MSYLITNKDSYSGVDPILESVGQPDFAWADNLLHSSYGGNCMQVRETVGHTNAFVGFDSDNNFDISAHNTHTSSANGASEQWYSQGSDVGGTTRLDASSDSEEITTDITPVLGPDVDMSFDGSDDEAWVDYGSAVFDADTFDIFVVYSPTNADAGVGILGYGTAAYQLTTGHLEIQKSDTGVRLYVNGLLRGSITVASQNGNKVIVHVWREGSSADTNVWCVVDGNTAVSGTGSNPGATGTKQFLGLGCGSISDAYAAYTGYINLVAIYNGTNLSSGDRTTARANIMTYYGITE
jgi:hypothetical protein